LSKRLRDYGEANPGGLSSFICECLEAKLTGVDSKRIAKELRTENDQITILRGELSEHEQRARDLQAQLNEQREIHQDTTDNRIELLAQCVRTGRINDLELFRAWADAPAGREVLPRCRFPTADDAFEWMSSDPDAVAWRGDNDPRVRKLQGGLK
jgi:hypothetical protein